MTAKYMTMYSMLNDILLEKINIAFKTNEFKIKRKRR
jgi:hypothetical protein